MLADRGSLGWRAGPGGERVQAAHLHGRPLVLRRRGDVSDPARAGSSPSPRRCERLVLFVHDGPPVLVSQWRSRRARSGRQMPQGRPTVNAAAWLPYSRCSCTLEESAAASVSATARGRSPSLLAVTVT